MQLTEACLFLGLMGCRRMDHGIIARVVFSGVFGSDWWSRR